MLSMWWVASFNFGQRKDIEGMESLKKKEKSWLDPPSKVYEEYDNQFLLETDSFFAFAMKEGWSTFIYLQNLWQELNVLLSQNVVITTQKKQHQQQHKKLQLEDILYCENISLFLPLCLFVFYSFSLLV